MNTDHSTLLTELEHLTVEAQALREHITATLPDLLPDEDSPVCAFISDSGELRVRVKNGWQDSIAPEDLGSQITAHIISAYARRALSTDPGTPPPAPALTPPPDFTGVFERLNDLLDQAAERLQQSLLPVPSRKKSASPRRTDRSAATWSKESSPAA